MALKAKPQRTSMLRDNEFLLETIECADPLCAAAIDSQPNPGFQPTAVLFDPIAVGRELREEAPQGVHGAWIDPVDNPVSTSVGGDQLAGPKSLEMGGNRRLREFERVDEFADAKLLLE